MIRIAIKQLLGLASRSCGPPSTQGTRLIIRVRWRNGCLTQLFKAIMFQVIRRRLPSTTQEVAKMMPTLHHLRTSRPLPSIARTY